MPVLGRAADPDGDAGVLASGLPYEVEVKDRGCMCPPEDEQPWHDNDCPLAPRDDAFDELADLIAWLDEHLDRDVAETYQGQPLAQDWARVAKVTEEAGEAIDALIGVTGQNPRKGLYGSHADLHAELCDVALTGLYALQHFTKNRHETLGLLMDRARYHRSRVDPTYSDGAQA